MRWDGLAWKADAAAMSAAEGGDLSAVAVDASGKRALAVGETGRILSWKGTAWKHEAVAEKLAIGRSLFDVRFDAKGRAAWVVGQYGIALRWNGSQWSRTATPLKPPGYVEGGAPVDVFGIWAVWSDSDGTDAWAVGNGTRILRWQGHSWRDDKKAANLQTEGNPFTGVRSIAMSEDGKRGWMVGGPFNLTWAGSKWQKNESPVGSQDHFAFLSVDCDATGTNAFAVGTEGAFWRWDGKRWNIDPTGRAAASGKTLSSVALNDSGKVGFAVGQGGFILHWDGKSWMRDPAPPSIVSGQYSSVATSADGKSGLAVSFDYDEVPLRWDGSRWSADTSRRPAEMRMDALWMAPSGDQAFGASEEGIYRWNGSEWTAEPSSGQSLHALALTPDGRLGFTGGVLGTIHRYDGSRWTEDEQGTREAGGKALYAMALSEDGKVGFAAGSYAFLRWDGSAWHKDAKLSDGHYNSVCLNAKGDLGFSVGETALRWDGKAWHPDSAISKVFTDTGPYHMALSADGRTGIAASFQGPVFFWDGTSWHRDSVASKLAQGQNPVSVCLDPAAGTGWVLGWHGFLMRYQATYASENSR